MNVITTTSSTRLEKAQDLLTREGIRLLLVSPSADLRYLSGYADGPSERPKLLVLGVEQLPVIVVPEFEAPGFANVPSVRVVTYGETDNPYFLLEDSFSRAGESPRVAVSDQTWASVLLRLQEAHPEAAFVPASPLLRELRMRKSPEEIELLAEAGKRADRAFEEIIQLRFAGRTEGSIADDVRGLLMEQGLQQDWGPIIGSGPNGASPHHTAGEREIHEGDPVVLDFGGTLEGYYADMTRTVHVGSPEDEFRKVYDVVREAQELGVRAVQPGASAQSVDSAARKAIGDSGYGAFFIHRTGHGIGLEDHEDPYIIEGNVTPLEAGMTFSVEPGIYLPGKFGVRIEDIVAVTNAGAQRLNNATRDLIVVH